MSEALDPEVVQARKALMSAIYALTGASNVRVSFEIAENLDRAWDAYDLAVARATDSPLDEQAIRERLRWPRAS